MRCFTCQSLSISAICKDCQENFLTSSFHKRELEKDFFVYSFYKFDEIKELIKKQVNICSDKSLILDKGQHLEIKEHKRKRYLKSYCLREMCKSIDCL